MYNRSLLTWNLQLFFNFLPPSPSNSTSINTMFQSHIGVNCPPCFCVQCSLCLVYFLFLTSINILFPFLNHTHTYTTYLDKYNCFFKISSKSWRRFSNDKTTQVWIVRLLNPLCSGENCSFKAIFILNLNKVFCFLLFFYFFFY